MFRSSAIAALVAVGWLYVAAQAQPIRVMDDFKKWPSPQTRLEQSTAQVGPDGVLVVRVEKSSAWSGLVIAPEKGAWDLASRAEIAVPVRNLGQKDLRVALRVDDETSLNKPTAQHKGGYFEAVLSPGDDAVTLLVPLGDGQPSPLKEKYLAMVGAPTDFVRRGAVNGGRIIRIAVFAPNAPGDSTFAVGPVIARGQIPHSGSAPESSAFPVVDEFGQYIHGDWPGKIHRDSDFAQHLEAQEKDLIANARPGNWNRFGGWADGPARRGTGFFRAEKLDGTWWLIDPEGRLFWSHGVVRVGTRIRVGSVYHGTPLPDREHFMRLPAKNSPLAAFYDTEPQSSRGYYLGRDNHAVYDFLEGNLYRKYGDDWRAKYAFGAQRRLASWGLNTIANSSDPLIYNQRKTPYTAIVYSAPLGKSEFRIQGSKGDWGKLPDPFDPGWRALIERTLQTELKQALNDPWCLGFFVDNELHWGDSAHVAEATLASPADQPAKVRLIDWLREKYASIERLNASWGTNHASWDALRLATDPPDHKRKTVLGDLDAMSEVIIDAYFRGCREAIKAASPNHMYLGCRFAGWGNAMVMRVAARYCDVVSINSYRRTLADLVLPAGLDRPILIGEFHFDSMDAPMHPAGLVLVANHADRGRAYRTYIRSALRNPAVVGTHWFQFYDQPTTGRFDGENYQTGLLDIADNPYPLTIAACREMGRDMYKIRHCGDAIIPTSAGDKHP